MNFKKINNNLFQKCETQGVNHCEDKKECTTKYVMQCVESGDSFEQPTYGYVKEHCDYTPKKECQTVSISFTLRRCFPEHLYIYIYIYF